MDVAVLAPRLPRTLPKGSSQSLGYDSVTWWLPFKFYSYLEFYSYLW
jgi:hypothetical protein